VQIDHEEMLCNDEIVVVREVARTFAVFIEARLADSASRSSDCA